MLSMDLREGAFGGVDLVGGEEVVYFVALVDAAEGASGCNDANAGVGGELGVDLVPVVAGCRSQVWSRVSRLLRRIARTIQLS